MTDFKLTRNGSGYYDETAYKAMNSMADSGEIWRYVFEANNIKEVLVVKNHGTFSTVLGLVDKESPDSVEIPLADGDKYTDPRMLRFVYNQNFSKRTDVVDEYTFNIILDRIQSALPKPKSEATCAKKTEAVREPSVHPHLGELRKIFGDEAVKTHLKRLYLTYLKDNMPEAASECLKHLDHILEALHKQRSGNNG